MKTFRILSLVTATLVAAVASETALAQCGWGANVRCKTCSLARRAVTGNPCATGCDTGCDVGCDVNCGAAAGCDAAPGCGCAAEPGCGCAAVGGCGGGKVCKLVKTEIEVEATCYGVKCKDICLPGCGSNCVNVECVNCDGKGCDSCCGCDSGAVCKVRYPTGKPGSCARVKNVKELVKFKTRKIICGYKWVVVDGGCGCDAGSGVSCDAGAGCAVPGCDVSPSQSNDAVPVPPAASARVPSSRLKPVTHKQLRTTR